MAIKSEVIDFKISCRCCLKSDAEFYKIDTFMIDDFHEKKISLLQCLVYSTQCEDKPELPKYICLTCSKMLHIVYKFLQTAREAHEILCQKLCPERCKATVAKRQKPKQTISTLSPRQGSGSNCETKRMRPNEMTTTIPKDSKMFPYRCKVCGERMPTELSLKEHVRTHLDLTLYSCHLCSYETRICQKMKLHYRMTHKVDATEEQLKLNVGSAKKSEIKTSTVTTSTPKSSQPLFQSKPFTLPNPLTNPIPNPLQALSLSQDTSIVQPTCTFEDIELLIPPTMIAQDPYYKYENREKNKKYIQKKSSAKLNKQAKKGGKQQQTITKLPESLQMGTVINDPNDLAVPQFEENACLTNELSVGTEFVVKSDGSVEQVLSNGVVIEYITAEPMDANTNATAQDVEMLIDDDAEMMNAVNEVIEHMDIDEIIVEDPPLSETLPTSTAALNQRKNLKHKFMQNATRTNVKTKTISNKQVTLSDIHNENQTKCVVCSKEFTTPKRLRNHLLCHKNLPKYFCDRCPYFTFISTELVQHYEAKHQQEPPNSFSKEKKEQFYICEVCNFISNQRDDLKIHYRREHKVEPTHLQLRPSIHEEEILPHGQPKQKTSNTLPSANNIPKILPDYPNGLRCALCPELFCWRSKYKEHLRAHVLSDTSGLQGPPKKMIKVDRNKKVSNNAAAGSHTNMKTKELEKVNMATTMPVEMLQNVVATPAVIVEKLIAPTTTTTTTTIGQPKAMTKTGQATELSSIPNLATIVFTNSEQNNIDMTTASTSTSMGHFIVNDAQSASSTMVQGQLQEAQQQQQLEEVLQVDDSAAIFCNMQDIMNTSDVAAVCTIPADAIQVVESDDVVIDNNIDFSFNEECLFEGFEEDDDEEVDDDDDVEDSDDDDDDVNDNNDAVTDQNLLLTSDDDDLDDFDDEQAKSMQKPFCMHCNSKFTSQYQFENHMFLHRGLAPYRCEMCTNLYNTKRALIRHYKAVHERIPTRDMIQAKGDKVTVDRTPMETLTVDEQKASTLMCAKCPYECLEHEVMLRHLNANHNISDESFIVSKLPFECPRCIRSYATKKSLIKHLQRSHLVATIIEQTAATTTTKGATTKTTTSVPTTTTNTAVMKSSNVSVSPKMLRSGKALNNSVSNHNHTNLSSTKSNEKLKLLLDDEQ